MGSARPITFSFDINDETILLGAEVYSRFDLNQDGIVGISLPLNSPAAIPPALMNPQWPQPFHLQQPRA